LCEWTVVCRARLATRYAKARQLAEKFLLAVET